MSTRRCPHTCIATACQIPQGMSASTYRDHLYDCYAAHPHCHPTALFNGLPCGYWQHMRDAGKPLHQQLQIYNTYGTKEGRRQQRQATYRRFKQRTQSQEATLSSSSQSTAAQPPTPTLAAPRLSDDLPRSLPPLSSIPIGAGQSDSSTDHEVCSKQQWPTRFDKSVSQ